MTGDETPLRRILREKGIRQLDLARRTRMTPNAVSLLATGRRSILDIRVSTLLAISRALDCTMEDLLPAVPDSRPDGTDGTDGS